MPFHGDHKRLRLHAQLAESVGIDPDRIFTGAQRRCRSRSTSRAPASASDVRAGMIFVDGVDIGDPDDVALRDRRALSADGVFIVVATISSDDGVAGRAAGDHLPRCPVPGGGRRPRGGAPRRRRAIALQRGAPRGARAGLLQEDLHDDIAEFVYERLRRRPMVLPVVVEV